MQQLGTRIELWREPFGLAGRVAEMTHDLHFSWHALDMLQERWIGVAVPDVVARIPESSVIALGRDGSVCVALEVGHTRGRMILILRPSWYGPRAFAVVTVYPKWLGDYWADEIQHLLDHGNTLCLPHVPFPDYVTEFEKAS